MDSRAWDERYAGAAPVWGLEPNRWVARETAGLPPGRALDLAAGEGRNALWLARQGWQVTAVDFSAVALARGRELAAARLPDGAAGGAAGEVDAGAGPSGVTWVHADVRTHPLPPAGFDLVLASYLHLPAAERRAVLRRAADATAPGGALLVVGHDTRNLTEGVGGPQDPAVLFTPEEVLADLGSAPGGGAPPGFGVVRAERVRRPVPVSDGEPAQAVDALVHLRRHPDE